MDPTTLKNNLQTTFSVAYKVPPAGLWHHHDHLSPDLAECLGGLLMELKRPFKVLNENSGKVWSSIDRSSSSFLSYLTCSL